MTFGDPDSPIQATLDIRDYRFFKRTAWGGEIGFGESYVNGEWESDDLPALFRVIILNRDHLSDGNLAASLITRIVERVAHEARKNTHGNSKKNIASHYDIGNRLYEMFLDAHMIYSCAIFHRDDDSLETAQENKMRAIIEKAGIGNGDHVLEIGCGWGGFAVFAAKETGCRVTGITVSQAQYEVACRRVREEGLLGRVTILLKDYRDIKGTYDTIVSIEMIEAVGKEFLGDFFRVCRKRLKPQGTMVFQSITIPDDRYARYIRERDWIQKHIFPGGHLPCMASLTDVIRKTTNFTIRTVDSIGPHYANTLRLWRQRFDHNWSALSELGFDLSFYRKWIYYFTICEAAFEHGAVDDIHMVLGPPDPDPARR